VEVLLSFESQTFLVQQKKEAGLASGLCD